MCKSQFQGSQPLLSVAKQSMDHDMEDLCWFTYQYRVPIPLQKQLLVSELVEEDSSTDEGGLEIVEEPAPTEEPAPMEEEEEDEDADLSDLPPEALHATSRAQFVHHMRPYVWVKFPSAMASEINAFINARWDLLKASKKVVSGE